MPLSSSVGRVEKPRLEVSEGAGDLNALGILREGTATVRQPVAAAAADVETDTDDAAIATFRTSVRVLANIISVTRTELLICLLRLFRFDS